jgi:hypothetical protein
MISRLSFSLDELLQEIGCRRNKQVRVANRLVTLPLPAFGQTKTACLTFRRRKGVASSPALDSLIPMDFVLVYARYQERSKKK